MKLMNVHSIKVVAANASLTRHLALLPQPLIGASAARCAANQCGISPHATGIAAPIPLPLHLYEDPAVLDRLSGPIHRMSRDFQDQEDLLLEAQVFLWLHEAELVGKTVSWVVQSAIDHLHNFLRTGRSIDSPKHQSGRCGLHEESDDPRAQADDAELDDSLPGAIGARDFLNALLKLLLPLDQEMLLLLREGFGQCEIALKVHLSQPAVSTHCKKINVLATRLISP